MVVVRRAVWLAALLLCVRLLTVAITGPAVVDLLSRQYSYKTGCRSHLAILIGMQGR